MDRSKDKRGGKLATFLAWRLAVATTLPMILLVAYLTHAHGREAHAVFAKDLEQTTQATAQQVEDYVSHHLAVLSSVAGQAELAPSFERAVLEPQLKNIRRQHPGFLTLIAADSDGWIVATEPQHDASGRPMLSRPLNVSDRDYFQAAMQGLSPYLSDVFLGRGFGHDPIVAISAPVRDGQSRILGMVEASLNLGNLSRFDPFRLESGESTEPKDDWLLILDEQDRVIYASDSERFPPLESLAQRNGILALKQAPENSSIRQKATANAEDDRPCLLSRSVTAQGWQIIGVRHLDLLVSSNTTRWLISGLLQGLALALAVIIAVLVTHRITRPLRQLTRSLNTYNPDNPETSLAETPANVPQEIRQLFDDYHRLTQRLGQSFLKQSEALRLSQLFRGMLEDTVRHREDIIAERTFALHQKTRELEEANRALAQQANEDGLTGLANRRHLDEFLQRSWRLSQRDGSPIALVLLDVDHFKAYNDHFGHPAGDLVLQKLAGEMKNMVRRPSDLAARYGGEEFALVLGNTNERGALQMAENLRQRVLDMAILHGQGDASSVVTVSLGVTVFRPGFGSAVEELVDLSDLALYQAKASGRNRVQLVTPHGQNHGQSGHQTA